MQMQSDTSSSRPPRIAVIVPCYCEREHILNVLTRMPDYVSAIYCVDDKCLDGTGHHIESHCADRRVSVIFNSLNVGVGGSVIVGYQQALSDGMDVLVKVDGDGQMDPMGISDLVRPILAGRADYTKGNRFYDLDKLDGMPRARLLGNVALSFLTKLSTGYWNVFDPTNGFTAIHASAARLLPLEKLDSRYFFESDMLFRLGTIRAVVQDVPQISVYGTETSHLSARKLIIPFFVKHCRNTVKRVFYNYYLRDFSIASIELLLGPMLFLFGLGYGLFVWWRNAEAAVGTPTGTIMVVALSLIMGMQLILSALQYDVQAQPRTPLQTALGLG